MRHLCYLRASMVGRMARDDKPNKQTTNLWSMIVEPELVESQEGAGAAVHQDAAWDQGMQLMHTNTP